MQRLQERTEADSLTTLASKEPMFIKFVNYGSLSDYKRRCFVLTLNDLKVLQVMMRGQC